MLYSITVFRKSYRLRDNVERNGTAGQATHNIIRRIRFEYWIYKSIDTNSEYEIIIVFALQQ